MAKVSIGLRGWRFDEDAVFAEDGDIRPLDEMPPDARERLLRLSALVGSPCDACWLIHGEVDLEQCNAAAVVYGEPMAEVVLCTDHEPDFLYWYREAGGASYRGSEDLEDAFHEWFVDGGSAPEGYGGIDHVETDPEELPDPEDFLPGNTAGCAIDGSDTAEDGSTEESDAVTAADSDLDLSVEYPGE